MTLLNTSPHLSPASEYKNCSSPVITPFFFSHLLNIRLHANTAFAQYLVTRAQREENRMTFCTQQPRAFKTDPLVRPGKEGSSLRWGETRQHLERQQGGGRRRKSSVSPEQRDQSGATASSASSPASVSPGPHLHQGSTATKEEEQKPLWLRNQAELYGKNKA